MPRLLPHPAEWSLQQAIISVIDSNMADGYLPSHLIELADGRHGAEGLAVCQNLLMSGETVDHFVSAVRQNPAPYLTLEDYVWRFGRAWGLSVLVVQTARDRVLVFDKLVGAKRYEHRTGAKYRTAATT